MCKYNQKELVSRFTLHQQDSLTQCFSSTVLQHISLLWEIVRCTVENCPISLNWAKKKCTERHKETQSAWLYWINFTFSVKLLLLLKLILHSVLNYDHSVLLVSICAVPSKKVGKHSPNVTVLQGAHRIKHDACELVRVAGDTQAGREYDI